MSQILYQKIIFLSGTLCVGYRELVSGDEPVIVGESCKYGWLVLLQGLGFMVGWGLPEAPNKQNHF